MPFSLDAEGILNIELPLADCDEYKFTKSVGASNTDYTPSSKEWTSQVVNAFMLPNAVRDLKKSAKKITTHRLLTSEDIFHQKLEVKLKKENENENRLKEKRKMDRQMKKDMKKENKVEN